MKKSMFRTIALLLVAVGMVWPMAVSANPGDPVEPVDLSWTKNYTMFVTGATNNDQMYAAKAAVEAAGGRVGIILPYKVMLGWIDPGKTASLVGKGGIKAVYQQPAGIPAGLTRGEIDGAKFFNSVASGAYSAARTARAATAKQGQILEDNREAPKISYADVVANLEANGLTIDGLAAKGIVLGQELDGSLQGAGATNSQYMTGTVVFNALFLESIGGIDANFYTWTDADHTLIQNEIFASLNFWVTQAASSQFKVPLSFIYPQWYKFGNAGQTNYEPIKHSSSQDYLWINQVMANRGFATGDKFARSAAFNAYFRNYYNANWSVVTYTAYNPVGAPSTFTDGYFAYFWGSYIQMCYRNDGWATGSYDIVNAHETGHAFGASDEYYQAGYGGCTSCAVASNGVLNGNCVYCNASAQLCMMRGNSTTLCGYTPGQIGWTNVRYVSVSTRNSSTGVLKDFFAPGELIRYQVYFCLGGPRLGTRAHTTRVRIKSNFFAGSLGAGYPIAQDTGWVAFSGAAPPATSGLSCWLAAVNTRLPYGMSWGPATVDAMVEVTEIGRGTTASIGNGKFYVTSGATTTQDGSPRAAAALFDEPADIISTGLTQVK